MSGLSNHETLRRPGHPLRRRGSEARAVSVIRVGQGRGAGHRPCCSEPAPMPSLRPGSGGAAPPSTSRSAGGRRPGHRVGALPRKIRLVIVITVLGMLLGPLATTTARRAEAYVVPVIDGANLAERFYEIIQRALQLDIDWETLWQLYEIWVEMRAVLGELESIDEAWETNLVAWLAAELASAGLTVDAWVLEVLLQDLEEVLLDAAAGVIFVQEGGGDLLETYPGFSLERAPEPWIEVEAAAAEATLETHQALLAMVAKAMEHGKHTADERVAAEELLMESDGILQTQQLNGVLTAGVGDLLQQQSYLLGASINAQTVDSAHRIHREGRYAEALFLWITEGSDEVVALRGAPEFEGGSMIP